MVAAKGDYANGSRVLINTGKNWRQDDAWIFPEGNFKNLGTRLLDANGDSMTDFLIHFDGGSPKLFLNKGRPSDLLVEINNNYGGITGIMYSSSKPCPHTFFPFHVQVVKAVTVSDSFGGSYTNMYHY